MNKLTNKYLLLITSIWCFTACSDDPEPVLPSPTIDNIEIGAADNRMGVIGRDFHLEMDVLAGDKIDVIQVKIDPKEGETYASPWSFELTWEQFKGAKNTTVHQHFDIPEDAVEGVYNFIIIVKDENGTALVESYDLQIMDPANLEVDPLLYIWMITTDQGDFHYVNELLESPEGVEFTKGEVLTSSIDISNVKGDGELYLLLIRKDQNHKPESVENIDFSKVIVYDSFKHQGEGDVYTFSNVLYGGVRPAPEFTIGTPLDNNDPQSDLTTGDNAWSNGAYYFGVVYTNTSYNMNLHYYFDLNVTGF